jgi:hypothetical protein
MRVPSSEALFSCIAKSGIKIEDAAILPYNSSLLLFYNIEIPGIEMNTFAHLVGPRSSSIHGTNLW